MHGYPWIAYSNNGSSNTFATLREAINVMLSRPDTQSHLMVFFGEDCDADGLYYEIYADADTDGDSRWALEWNDGESTLRRLVYFAGTDEWLLA